MTMILQLNISMDIKGIKQAILHNQEFVDFLSPKFEKAYIFFSANNIPFVLFHRLGDSFDIYLSTLYISGLDPQIIGQFVDRVKEAIREIRAEKYPKN